MKQQGIQLQAVLERHWDKMRNKWPCMEPEDSLLRLQYLATLPIIIIISIKLEIFLVYFLFD